MKSRNQNRVFQDTQIAIVRTNNTGKEWVKIHLLNGRKYFMPSFEHLYHIIKKIGECEDIKYPKGKGRKMVLEFLRDTLMTNFSFEALAKFYKLPTKSKK